MATGGRKPKPAALHLLNGNPSKRSLEKRFEKETDASKLKTKEVPKPPVNLDKMAKDEWKRMAQCLIELNILTKVDLSGLEMYCVSYSRWKQAEIEISQMASTTFTTESGYQQQVPQIGISKMYQSQCRAWMSEYGLTPSARARGVKQVEEEASPQSKLFKDLI